MKNIIKHYNQIDISKPDIFIASENIYYNGIPIHQNSLISVLDNIIYVNETDLGFVSRLLEIYPELSKYKIGDELSFDHPIDCNLIKKYEVEKFGKVSNRTTNRWYKDHFCISGVPTKEDLESLPTINFNSVEYSTWGYSINIKTMKIDSGFYKKNGTFYEITSIGLDDLKVL